MAVAKKLIRKIYIIDEISDESYLAFTKRLSALERQGKGAIDVELCSPGGIATYALAFANRIQSSPCEIKVTAYGEIASAAVLILAVGDHRVMAADAWVMVHEDSISFSSGSAMPLKDMERITRHGRRMEHQWAALLANLTSASQEEWADLHAAETWLTAEKCLDLGLVDAII